MQATDDIDDVQSLASASTKASKSVDGATSDVCDAKKVLPVEVLTGVVVGWTKDFEGNKLGGNILTTAFEEPLYFDVEGATGTVKLGSRVIFSHDTQSNSTRKVRLRSLS